MNLLKFSKSKCKALHLDCDNLCYQYKLGDVRMENNPAKKDLGVLVDGKLDMRQQCTFGAQKAIHILGCIKRSTVSRLREVFLPLYSELVRPRLECCVQMSYQYRRDVGLLECIQRRATKMTEGMAPRLRVLG